LKSDPEIIDTAYNVDLKCVKFRPPSKTATRFNDATASNATNITIFYGGLIKPIQKNAYSINDDFIPEVISTLFR